MAVTAKTTDELLTEVSLYQLNIVEDGVSADKAQKVMMLVLKMQELTRTSNTNGPKGFSWRALVISGVGTAFCTVAIIVARIVCMIRVWST